MIKVDTNKKPIIRETTAPWEYEADGEIKTDDIRVQYYDWTTKELKEQEADLKAKQAEGDLLWNTDSLLGRIHSLPDLVDEKEKPVEITLEFLDAQSIKNIAALKKAIDDDLNPEKKSHSGSLPEN
ncbi:MAG: hypothetical protein ABWZ66_13025 [Pyrinomonadaceae bacterium]